MLEPLTIESATAAEVFSLLITLELLICSAKLPSTISTAIILLGLISCSNFSAVSKGAVSKETVSIATVSATFSRDCSVYFWGRLSLISRALTFNDSTLSSDLLSVPAKAISLNELTTSPALFLLLGSLCVLEASDLDSKSLLTKLFFLALC